MCTNNIDVDKNVEQPKMSQILDIKEINENVKSFTIKYKIEANPGQFILLWLPRLGEKPFAISSIDDNVFTTTICRVGNFTDKLFELKKSDKVGIRGPYGSSFNIVGKRILLVGGGYGVGPLSFLCDEALKYNLSVDFIIGARTEKQIIKVNMNSNNLKIHYVTDDGSFGEKGTTIDLLRNILKTDRYENIYTVGPETMMREVMNLSDEYNINCQVSLERYMKCGIGICGQCVVDPLGIRICKEGPVLDKKTFKEIISSNNYHRDEYGRKIY